MPLLQPKMKTRHLNMIAVGKHLITPSRPPSSYFAGGSIGTGLFVSSGAALHSGGPAGVIIAWIIVGIMLINVTQARLYISFPATYSSVA